MKIPPHVPPAVRQADADHLQVELGYIQRELERRSQQARPHDAATSAQGKTHAQTLSERADAAKRAGDLSPLR